MIGLTTSVDEAYAISDEVALSLHILDLDCEHVQYHKEYNNSHGCSTVQDTLNALATYPDPWISTMLPHVLIYPEMAALYDADVKLAYLELCSHNHYHIQLLKYIFGDTLPEDYLTVPYDPGMQDMFEEKFDYSHLQREFDL